jgi:hypothetical protein
MIFIYMARLDEKNSKCILNLMSLYKVISNYYSDILDTINTVYVQNGKDFDIAYSKLNGLVLIKKLASMSNRLQSLQDSDLNYWKTQQKTYTFYFATLIVIIVSIFSGFITFAGFKIAQILSDKELPSKMRWFEIFKTLILYLTMFFIVFSVLFILLKNLKWAIDRAKKQQEKNKEDFKRFRDLMFGTGTGTYVMILLNYIGLIEKGKTAEATSILNNMKTELKRLQKKSGGTVVDKDKLQEYVSVMDSLNETTINNVGSFSQLLSDMQANLKNFFDNGNGYYKLKLEVVSSSNILTLREIKRVMNYYYFLTLKKSTDQNMELSNKNKEKILNQLVIQPVITISISSLMSNQKKYLNTVDEIARNLVPYQIDLSKYSKFVLDGITSGAQEVAQEVAQEGTQQVAQEGTQQGTQQGTQDLNKAKSDFINDFFKRLNKEVYIKQQTSLKNLISSTGSNDIRFYSPDEFIDNLNDMSFNDFDEGLEIQYLTDTMNMFYRRISDAKDKNSMDDINYNGNKSGDLYKHFIIIFIIAIVLGWCYYLLTWIQDFMIMWYANGKREIEEGKTKGLYDDIGIPIKGNNQAESESKEAKRGKLKYDVRKVNTQYYVNSIIKLIIPTACVIFFISLIYSYAQKQYEVFNYNKDVIEENTSMFMKSTNDVFMKIKELKPKISEPLQRIGDQSKIPDEEKFELFRLIKEMIDRFEKCNYIMEAAKNKFPFPYAEISADIFMLFALIGGLIYVTTSFKPFKKGSELFTIKKRRGDLELGIVAGDESIEKELEEDMLCHNNEVETIIFTLKIIFFLLVFIFLLFYSMKVLSSSTEFGTGIYNSSYFDESRCYGAGY